MEARVEKNVRAKINDEQVELAKELGAVEGKRDGLLKEGEAALVMLAAGKEDRENYPTMLAFREMYEPPAKPKDTNGRDCGASHAGEH